MTEDQHMAALENRSMDDWQAEEQDAMYRDEVAQTNYEIERSERMAEAWIGKAVALGDTIADAIIEEDGCSS